MAGRFVVAMRPTNNGNRRTGASAASGRRAFSALWLALILSSFLLPRASPQQTPPVEGEERNCLFVNNLNSKLVVVRLSGGEGAKRDVADAYALERAKRAVAQYLGEATDVGFLPKGLLVYKGIAYVASQRTITRFDAADALKKLKPAVFVDFAQMTAQFYCSAQGIAAYDDILYVACDADSDPYSLLKFSLRDDDYGAFLVGSSPYFGKQLDRLVIRDGVYPLLNPYGFGTLELDGMALLASDFSSNNIYIALLDGLSRDQPIEEMHPFANRFNVLLGFPPEKSSETWQGMSFGSNGNLHVVRNYLRNTGGGESERVGDVIVIGPDGSYQGVRVAETPNLGRAYDIAAGPDDNFYISEPIVFGESRLSSYDQTTGEWRGVFFEGGDDAAIEPRALQWAACPIFPEPEPPGDGGSGEGGVTDGGDSGNSGDDARTLILATVLPIGGGIAACVGLLCCAAVVVLLAVERWKRKRRRTYDHPDGGDHDSDGARSFVGRGGKKRVYTFREIDPDDLEVGKILGQGAFGKVYRGKWRGAPVAIKTFDFSLDEADENMLIEIREEAQMMHTLGNHPNVITFVGAVTQPKENSPVNLSLATEYCTHGSLFDYLVKRRKKVPLIALVRMARDAATGIAHLHREKVIHRDIAARNILVGDHGAVFISDFGMARLKHADVNTTVSNIGPIKWMAPECMLRREYSEASDVFAFGVTLWEMVTRKEPWKGMDPTQIVIAVTKKNTRLRIPQDCDPVLRKIIVRCWRTKPEKRPTMAEIVQTLSEYHDRLTALYGDMSSDSDTDKEGPTMIDRNKNANHEGSPIGTSGSGGERPKTSSSDEMVYTTTVIQSETDRGFTTATTGGEEDPDTINRSITKEAFSETGGSSEAEEEDEDELMARSQLTRPIERDDVLARHERDSETEDAESDYEEIEMMERGESNQEIGHGVESYSFDV